MTRTRHSNRRQFISGLAGVAAAWAFPAPALAQAAAKVVVSGGGFGGASCARALRRINPALQITLVEPNPTFTACPFSNEVIAGLRDLGQQQFGYDSIARAGITIAAVAATAVDAQARQVRLGDGSVLP